MVTFIQKKITIMLESIMKTHSTHRIPLNTDETKRSWHDEREAVDAVRWMQVVLTGKKQHHFWTSRYTNSRCSRFSKMPISISHRGLELRTRVSR